MGRLIEEVHQQIYRAIPFDQIQMRNELRTYVETLWNKAPEVRAGPEVYLPYASILAKWIDPHGENLQPWQLNVVNIFNGVEKEMEEDMEDFDYMHHTMAHY